MYLPCGLSRIYLCVPHIVCGEISHNDLNVKSLLTSKNLQFLCKKWWNKQECLLQSSGKSLVELPVFYQILGIIYSYFFNLQISNAVAIFKIIM